MPKKKWFWNDITDGLLRRMYDPTVKGRSHEIAARLRVPRWAVNRRAAALGLSRPKDRPWSAQEKSYLEANFHHVSVKTLARRLGRSPTAVTAASLSRLRELARSSGLLKEALAAQHVVAGLVTARAGQVSRSLNLPNDAAAVQAFYWPAGAELGLAAATGQPLDQLDSHRLLASVGDGVFLTAASV